MKNTLQSFVLLLLVVLLVTSCDEDDSIPISRGCMDSKSLTYNPSANENDNSCSYSNAVLYASSFTAAGVPIAGIDITINGNYIGTITSVYPSGPGNCSAIGTVSYQFTDGNQVDWNSVVHLQNGGTIFDSGTISPNSFSACLKVNVTN